jgi:NDP-sugar pyrophosphorylase family protein
VILAAGKGERMKPLTNEIPKALVNVAGKPLLKWAIERYIRSNIKDIVIAVGWKGDMIEDYVSRFKLDSNIVHVDNYETGPLQTLMTAIETFDGDFLVSPVDAIIEPASVIGTQSHHFEEYDPSSMTLAVGLEATSGTFVEFDDDGLLTGIGNVTPKANKVARSAMLFIAHTQIRELLQSALDAGRQKVVEVLNQWIKDGGRVRCYNVSQTWFDIDTLSDLIDVNQHMLQKADLGDADSIFIPSGDSIEIGNTLKLKSNITLGKGTIIRGSVVITASCEIGENCRIGPNVTIASNSSISNSCEVTNTIIFGESKVSSQSRIDRQIIHNSLGYNVEV